MNFAFGNHRLGAISHFSVISRILIKHGLGEIAARVMGRRTSRPVGFGWPEPVRVRRALEELGPSFIKLGQLLSTRADLFPPEYIRELSKLQDQVPAIPFNQIRQVVEAELGKPIEAVFSHFEPICLAAASVAQVHAARLHNGENVAVKVVRPSIERGIRKDVQLMYYVAEKLEKKSELGRILGAVNLVNEFERTIMRELDMLIEAAHIDRFAHTFRESKEIYIPKVHWSHTTKSVLVMERIQGFKMDDIEQIQRHGIDPKQVALAGLRSFSRQLMEAGIFHADPHPGNVLVMPDGRVSLIDFGIVGYLDEETMLRIAHVFLGFAEHDYDLLMEAFEAAGLIDGRNMDLKQFRADLVEMSEPFYGRSLSTISVRDVYDQVMRLVYKYHIRLPRNLLLLLKTFIQTESLGKILGSDASLLEVTQPYAKRLLQQGIEAQKLLKNLGRDARTAGGYLRGMPKLVIDLIRRLANGEHRLELMHGGLDQASGKFEKGLNRLTIGLVLSASIIAAALILNSSQQTLTFHIDWFGGHTLSITQLLGIAGYSIATILGLWLVLSIIRSGKL